MTARLSFGVIPSFGVYLFDVDGTLVDSAADICGAIQQVLAETPQNQIPDEFLRGYIGRHLIDLFDDLFPQESANQKEKWIQQYREVYPLRKHASTSCFEGVAEVLARLPGKKATATTKGTPTTRVILQQFGLLPYFDHVQGTDGFPAKPNPEVIFRALQALGAEPRDCLFVGDSPADMEAAQRAGVRSCAVTYGYGRRNDIARWAPDYWIDHLRELIP
jgi:phosphoglycolate phosphatase